MAQYQSDYPTQSPSDEYGNQVGRKDEYGNPIQHGVTGTGTGYETHGSGAAPTADLGQKIKEKLPGGHKTDDPYGTTPTNTAYGGQHQEKPGVVDQIKQKLPGGRKEEPYGTAHHTTTTPGYGAVGEHQYPGMVDQMKEKLPGGHKEDPYSTGHHTTTTPGYGAAGEHQKPGMVDQMKEKLPGGQKKDPYSTGHHNTTAAPAYGTTGAAGEHHEKKGIMDKIKEKLPGGHSTTR